MPCAWAPLLLATSFAWFAPAFEDTPGNAYPRKHTIFVNFDGGDFRASGVDNSAENATSVLLQDASIPAYGLDMAARTSILQAVEADLAPYGVRVVDTRPAAVLPYTLVTVGGSSDDLGVGPGAAVTVLSDCGARNQRHLGWVFETANQTADANLVASIVGITAGLDSTTNPDSLMASTPATDDVGFTDLCEEVAAVPVPCTQQHEQYCTTGEQNADAELAFVFGDATPDEQPPSVEILQPPDGARYELGQDVELTAIVSDDYGGYGWKTTVRKDGEVVFDKVDYTKVSLDDQGRVLFSLQNAEAGAYTLTVTAMDHADHTTEDTVTITIEGAPDGSTGADGTGGSTDLGTGSTSTGEDPTSSASDDSGEDGCSCRTTPRCPTGWWTLWLPVCHRRRRRAS